VRDDPTVIALVRRAAAGDAGAWDELVERYAPLVWSICRRYRLDRPDADDVGQGVWLRLVEQLPSLREPAALPGWLATTTRRECLRVQQTSSRLATFQQVLDDGNIPDEQAPVLDHELLVAERDAVLREALMRLSPSCRQLLALLIADPPVPYVEISARLHISVGSIGPCRARCLDKLRRDPAIAALIDTEVGTL